MHYRLDIRRTALLNLHVAKTETSGLQEGKIKKEKSRKRVNFDIPYRTRC